MKRRVPKVSADALWEVAVYLGEESYDDEPHALTAAFVDAFTVICRTARRRPGGERYGAPKRVPKVSGRGLVGVARFLEDGARDFFAPRTDPDGYASPGDPELYDADLDAARVLRDEAKRRRARA